MKKSIKLLAYACLYFLCTNAYTANAQLGWLWGNRNTYSNVTTAAEEDSWLSAIGPNASLYYVTTVGGTGISPIMTGLVTHFGSQSVTDSSDNSQMIVSRIDSNGKNLWVRSTQHANVGCVSITSDKDGAVYVLGQYVGSMCALDGVILHATYPSGGLSSNMYFIVKYDENGTLLWATNVAPSNCLGIDNTLCPSGTIGVDTNKNVYVSGVFVDAGISIGTDKLMLTHGARAIFVAKFDGKGTPVWARSFDGNVKEPYLNAVVTDQADVYLYGIYEKGTIAFGSSTLTSATGQGIFLTKIDFAGNVQWANNKECDIDDITQGISVDANHNIYLIGSFAEAALAFGTDTLKNVLPGKLDIFLAKYGPSGKSIWATSIGGTQSDQGFSISPDIKGNIWITGSVGDRSTVIPGYPMYIKKDTFRLPTVTAYDDPMLIAQFDTAGKYIRGISITGGGDDLCTIVVDNTGSFYLCGDWSGSKQVFGSDTLKLTEYEQTFVARYRYDTFATHPKVAVDQVSLEPRVSIFPSPARKEIVLSSTEKIGHVAITNTLGQLCYTNDYYSERKEVTINVANLSPGLYIVNVDGMKTEKFEKLR